MGHVVHRVLGPRSGPLELDAVSAHSVDLITLVCYRLGTPLHFGSLSRRDLGALCSLRRGEIIGFSIFRMEAASVVPVTSDSRLILG